MPSTLRLNAATHADRHAITGAVNDAIQQSGGWIVDFHHFSNQSLCINFEIEARHICRLKVELESLDLRLAEASRADLSELANDARTREIAGALLIAFIHGEPEQRREIPSIPG